MTNLYEHQERIINEDRKKSGIFLGTGSGKTRIALELARGKTLVICPKQQKLDETWERNAEKFGIKIELTTISKETFKRDWETLPRFDTVIVDESHMTLGILPETRQKDWKQIPKTSQIFAALYSYLRKTNPERLYLCSATPAPKPMSVWGMARLFGWDWDYYRFREVFYTQIKIGRRHIWVPRKTPEAKERLANVVKKMGYTGTLNDFMDVPEQTHKEVLIDLTPEQKNAIKIIELEEADPLVQRAKKRTIENGILHTKDILPIVGGTDRLVSKVEVFPSKKIEYILERAQEFPKMVVFAYYRAQIREIEKALKKEGYTVSTLTGETKDRKGAIEKAENDKEHIIIIQSNIAAGYELPSFPCVIYASKSWQFVSYEQSLGRVLRANKLKKNLYIHLLVKGVDSDCHKAIMNGMDFQEKLSEQ